MCSQFGSGCLFAFQIAVHSWILDRIWESVTYAYRCQRD